MNKKSVLFLPRWYPNKLDVQLGIFIQRQAVLIKNDFNVTVIYAQAVKEQDQKFEIQQSESEGIHEIIVYFKSDKGLFRKLINGLRYKKAQQIAHKQIKNSVDLCHVFVPYRSLFLALKIKVPFVITEHWSGHLTGAFSRKNFADKFLYKRYLKRSKNISCVSHLLQKQFEINTGFSSVVIPNHIEFSDLTSRKKETENIEILTVSDLDDATKNISGLLTAFSQSLKINNQLRLTIVGGGPDENKLIDLIQKLHLNEFVILKGRLKHNEVLDYYQQCDFYICNSNVETFGMAVAEALMAGKPVIVTRCGGPEEFVNNENGILIPLNNNQKLTDAILQMSGEYSKFNALKITHNINQKYGAEAVKKMWIDFYNAVLL